MDVSVKLNNDQEGEAAGLSYNRKFNRMHQARKSDITGKQDTKSSPNRYMSFPPKTFISKARCTI